jgi:hypothetical protein
MREKIQEVKKRNEELLRSDVHDVECFCTVRFVFCGRGETAVELDGGAGWLVGMESPKNGTQKRDSIYLVLFDRVV